MDLFADELIHKETGSNCHIESDIKNASPCHSHDFYEVFIILSGNCIHCVNGIRQPLAEGDMVFIRPGDYHSYEYDEDPLIPCSFLNVNFICRTAEDAFAYIGSRDFVHKLCSPKEPPILKLDSDNVEYLKKKATCINVYEPVSPRQAAVIARTLLLDILTYFYTLHYKNDSEKAPEWFDRLLLDIQDKNRFTEGIACLTRLSGKSPAHINRTFKKHLHITPTEYINRLKLNYAKMLLITTNLPIIDIAYDCGFDNLSHFYHLFGDMFGASPGSFRKK